MQIRWLVSLILSASMLSGAFALPGPFPFSATPLATLQVSPGGNDTTGDGSPSHPFLTISRAAQHASPGTEIVLTAGVHTPGGLIYDLRGTPEHPIWIRGASPTNRPTLQGGPEAIHLVRARYVIIQDLEIAGASANGINCDDGGAYADDQASGFLVFSNLFIRDIGGTGNQDGIKLSGIRDFYILNTEVTRWGGNQSGSAIDMVGCHRGLIKGGSFYDATGNAIQAKGGTTAIEIRQCVIAHPGHRGINIGGSTSFEFFRPPLTTNFPNAEARDIRVLANVFIGGTASVAFASSTGCTVANNTIIEPSRWVFRILQETTTSGGFIFDPCGNHTFRNNMVYYRHDTLNRYVNEGGGTDPASFTVFNNLWYPYDQPAASPYALPGTVSGNRYGQNPLFADTASRDYRITMASPAALTGTPPPVRYADFSGTLFLDPPSIGAFEISGDTDADELPDYWEIEHFQSLAATPLDDPDGDGVNNRDEYRTDTNPLDAESNLAFLGITVDGDTIHARCRGGQLVAQHIETAPTPDTTNWQPIAVITPPTPITNAISIPEGMQGFLRINAFF